MIHIRKITGFAFAFLSAISLAGCIPNHSGDYTYIGTIIEVKEKEKVFVMEEERKDNVYEFPVNDVELYHVGQKMKITVTLEADHSAFRMEKIKSFPE